MGSIKKIICALDLSDINLQIVEYAVSMARNYGAGITVVYASPLLTQYEAFDILPKSLEGVSEEIAAGAEKSMEKIIAEHFVGIPVDSLVEIGTPAEVILRAAAASEANMIVMGTRGRSAYERFLMGSVAQRVVKRAKIPVLTVPYEDSK